MLNVFQIFFNRFGLELHFDSTFYQFNRLIRWKIISFLTLPSDFAECSYTWTGDPGGLHRSARCAISLSAIVDPSTVQTPRSMLFTTAMNELELQPLKELELERSYKTSSRFVPGNERMSHCRSELD